MTVLLLTIPLVAAAPIPKEHRRVAVTLVGKWEFVTATLGNQPDSSYAGAKWVLEKDGKGTRLLRGTPDTPARYKADTTSKTRDFDWTINDNTFPGIYQIQGDTLTVALALFGQRPTEFSGQSVYVFTMKRAK